MPINVFLDCLLSDARGKGFALTMIDSVQIGRFPRERLQRLMRDVLVEYQADKESVTTSALAIGLINRVASGFLADAPEKHVMAGYVATDAKPNGKLAHALRSQTITWWLSGISDPHLIPEPKPPSTSNGIAAYKTLMNAINKKIADSPESVFDADMTLGYEVPARAFIGLAWLTQESTLPSPPVTGDDIRDALGLETAITDYQILLVCDAVNLGHHLTARPTFADGGNSRFRIIPDSSANDPSWGTTVHLGKLSKGDASVDGMPERVAEKVPLRTLKPEFRPIGWIEAKRGDTVNDSDDAFMERLLRGRDENELCEIIEELLK
ncbi:MAG: hypothetical protein WAW10_11540 [Gallionella sp.]